MITLRGFGISNYHNKLKLVLMEKQISFQESLVSLAAGQKGW